MRAIPVAVVAVTFGLVLVYPENPSAPARSASVKKLTVQMSIVFFLRLAASHFS